MRHNRSGNQTSVETMFNIKFFSTPVFCKLLKQHQMNLPVDLFITSYLMSEHDIKETEITLEADLFKDLSLDSLDFIEFETCIQAFFGLKVRLDDAIDNGELDYSIGEIIKYCEDNKNPQHIWPLTSAMLHAFTKEEIEAKLVTV